jgi:uncharacterized SAM-binding protein YcdF (DUF218 family)
MFVLGKLFGFLLHPFLWGTLLALFGVFTRDSYRRRKRLVAAGVLLLVFSNPWLINRLVLAWQPPKKEFTHGEVYPTGILLGGYAGFDNAGKQAYFNGSSDRFLETVRLYQSGHIHKIILTGANGQLLSSGFVEADFAKATLLDMGVPGSDIITERKSRNTIENAAFTKSILDSLGIQGPQTLITSALHMPRAEMIFRKAGMDVRPYPCAYLVVPDDGAFTWEAFVPSAHAFNLWDNYLKEVMGYLVVKLR